MALLCKERARPAPQRPGQAGADDGTTAVPCFAVCADLVRRRSPAAVQPPLAGSCSRSNRFISLPLALRGSGVALQLTPSGTL